MKRFHVHVAVPDLEQGVRFYSTVFGAQPSVVKPDYAKWMLDDPRVNFAISQREGANGRDTEGYEVDEATELDEIHSRLAAADAGLLERKTSRAATRARTSTGSRTRPVSHGRLPHAGHGAHIFRRDGCGEGESAAARQRRSRKRRPAAAEGRLFAVELLLELAALLRFDGERGRGRARSRWMPMGSPVSSQKP